MPVEHAKGRRSHHAALILTGCWSDPDVTGPTNSCATYLYPRLNPKTPASTVIRGNITTCTTSCTPKGAH